MSITEIDLIINIITLSSAVIFSLIAIRMKDLVKSIIFYTFTSISVAVIFYILNSPFASVLELTVGAGLITVLLLVTLTLTHGKEIEKEEE